MDKLLQNEYFRFMLILVGFILVAGIVHLILRNYLRRLTARTKSDIDDIVLGLVTKPLYFFLILLGFYFGIKTLSFFKPYHLWVERLFFTLAMLLGAYTFSRVFSLLITHWIKVQKKYEKTPKLLSKVVIVIIYVIVILIILKYFDVEITPLIAALGLGGLAVGLALQNTLSNFFAGLHIITDRPINIGDFIEIEDGVSGYVEDIGWRSTRIRTLPNTLVIVPNSKLAETTITNRSQPIREMSIVVQCGVDYSSDLEKVERITIEVAKNIQQNVPGAVKSFEPFIRFHTFGDSNINFSIILRVEKPVDKYIVKHEFIKALKKRYDQEGIEISLPARKIYQAKK